MKNPKVIITEKLNKYYKMFAEKDKITEELSNLAKKIRTKNDNNEVDYKNSDGKIIKVKEKILWQEVKYLGLNSNAGKLLRAKYEKLFKIIDREQAKIKELRQLETDTFGFDFTQMSMVNVITLIRSLIKYETKN